MIDRTCHRRARTRTTIMMFAAILLAAVSATIAASGRPEGAAEELVIGFQAIPNGEIVAKALGRHEATLGVPVRWVQFSSGTELNAAIASGSVHIGLGGSSTTVAAIVQGVPAEVIWIHDVIGDNEALVVRSGSGIDAVEDLVGRRVAAPFGATTHYHLLVALERAGVDPASVEILDMRPADMLAAWQRGDIDAGFVWEPTLAAMVGLGGEVLLSSRVLAEAGFLTGDIAIVHEPFGRANPELVARYLANQEWAIRLIRSEPGRAAAAIADEFDLPPGEARRQMETLVFLDATEQLGSAYLGRPGAPGALVDVFVATAQFLADQGTIRSVPDRELFEVAINSSYLERALEVDGE